MNTTVEDAANAAPALGKVFVVSVVTALAATTGLCIFHSIKKAAHSNPLGVPETPVK